ncbi:MAG: Gfo/Idh/MocA family oxidoreductase [Planctomycetes bacterium]|nr:Gfo/Idh/MocA family oxidoreductase [Planctomycetota bacterium]
MIRAGFIGTGGISGVHLECLKSRKDVEIVALCDIDKKNLKRRQSVYGGKGFTDFNRMFDEVELDAVWVCTPSQVRLEPLVACADRKIPIFCEKPAERTVKAAEKVAKALAARKARVQVGYVFRPMATVEHLREAMADDRIHAVQSFYGCGVSLKRSLPDWFYDKDRSGGALVDQATHNLDLLRYLIGEVQQVRGVASNPVHKKAKGYTIDETLSLSFVFADGTVGSHTHTWVGDMWRNVMVLSGEKRLYRLDLGRGVLETLEGNRKLIFAQDNDWRMYRSENERFLEMVASGDWSKNPSTYADAVETLKLTVACDKAVAGTKVRSVCKARKK